MLFNHGKRQFDSQMEDTSKKFLGPRVGRWLIYGLLDPRTKTLIYVGKTHKRRENRLAEHIESANNGSTAPIHDYIRNMIANGVLPVIFVLARVPPSNSWQDEERRQMEAWRSQPKIGLPILHPPQTPKSKAVEIRGIELLNLRSGG